MNKTTISIIIGFLTLVSIALYSCFPKEIHYKVINTIYSGRFRSSISLFVVKKNTGIDIFDSDSMRVMLKTKVGKCYCSEVYGKTIYDITEERC